MPAAEGGFEILRSEGDGAGGWALAARVAETSPLFQGHFPGHPIVPGVALLALVVRAAADWRGGEGRLVSLRGLKLRRPVGPGEALELRLRWPAEVNAHRGDGGAAGPEGEVFEISFELRRAEEEGAAIAIGRAGFRRSAGGTG